MKVNFQHTDKPGFANAGSSGQQWQILDVATGQNVPNVNDVLWADDETGEHEIVLRGDKGEPLVAFDKLCKRVLHTAIKIIPPDWWPKAQGEQ